MAKIDEKRLEKIYAHLPDLHKQDKALIEKAYFFAKKAHRGQKRYSGDPYFAHACATATHLAELGVDTPTVVAGFLHDTIEDAKADREEIQQEFGDEVLFLVEGVTKLGKLRYHGLKRHTESLRKLFLAVSQDIRVLIIKLADRLHNMETLEHVPEDKQKRIAVETLEIYAPLAHRLGIGTIKGALEDLAFPYVYPEEHEQVRRLLKERGTRRLDRLDRISRVLLRELAEADIHVVARDYRVKRLYSLWQKLQKYDMNITKIYDMAALRIQLPTQEDCYKALGVIHARWRPLPGRIKDYIANPKPNGYQSLHTTIFDGDGSIVEVQVRTPEMHALAEFGAASHVSYKSGKKDDHGLAWVARILSPFVTDKGTDDKTTQGAAAAPPWLKQLSELQESVNDPKKFLRNLRTDFFDERVFAFTPRGEVVDLPAGARPVDFAYAIHTDLGDHMSSVKINGKLSSLNAELQNGDIVEIETKPSAKPTQKWLGHAQTTFARRKIRQALQKKR